MLGQEFLYKRCMSRNDALGIQDFGAVVWGPFDIAPLSRIVAIVQIQTPNQFYKWGGGEKVFSGYYGFT